MAVKSYEEATTLITAINYVLALRNFVDPRRNKCKFVCTLMYDISMIGALNIIIILSQIENYKHIPFTIEVLLYVFLIIIITSGYVAIGIIGLYSSKDALALLKQINTVDEKLMKLGAKIEYRGLFQYVIINGLLWALGWITIFALFLTVWLMNKVDKLSLIGAICYVCILNIASVTLYDFNTVVYWLRKRFKQTNELLTACLLENHQTKADESIKSIHDVQSKLRSNDCSFQRSIDIIDVQCSEKESQSTARVYLIHEIRLVHLQLCYTSKMLNRLFETQILSHVFMTLIYATIILYHIYMALSRENEFFDKLYTIILYVLDAANHCAKIGVASYNCEHAANQRNKVIEIIHRSPLYEKDTDIKDEMVQFCLQISYMRIGKVQCTSLWLNYGFICQVGTFCYEIPFIYTKYIEHLLNFLQCLGLMLTNLIVMIQWSNEITKKESVVLANESSYFFEHLNN
ncbi:unnamed protein product [Xylocopa violacea]|uniref:Gustatory receptor n=1 Tax=Xylocopa violacea TaxID=135666 RepID=A0ABP1NGJ5_XYLVO